MYHRVVQWSGGGGINKMPLIVIGGFLGQREPARVESLMLFGLIQIDLLKQYP